MTHVVFLAAISRGFSLKRHMVEVLIHTALESPSWQASRCNSFSRHLSSIIRPITVSQDAVLKVLKSVTEEINNLRTVWSLRRADGVTSEASEVFLLHSFPTIWLGD